MSKRKKTIPSGDSFSVDTLGKSYQRDQMILKIFLFAELNSCRLNSSKSHLEHDRKGCFYCIRSRTDLATYIKKLKGWVFPTEHSYAIWTVLLFSVGECRSFVVFPASAVSPHQCLFYPAATLERHSSYPLFLFSNPANNCIWTTALGVLIMNGRQKMTGNGSRRRAFDKWKTWDEWNFTRSVAHLAGLSSSIATLNRKNPTSISRHWRFGRAGGRDRHLRAMVEKFLIWIQFEGTKDFKSRI